MEIFRGKRCDLALYNEWPTSQPKSCLKCNVIVNQGDESKELGALTVKLFIAE